MLPDAFENTAALLLGRCAAAPDAPLFIAADGTAFTRARFTGMVAARQQQLQADLMAGDAVLVASRRGVSFFVDLVALWASGAVAVPYDGNAPAEEITRLKNLTGAKTLLNDSVAASTTSHQVHCLSGHAGKTASILVTSGSSGLPKGCLLTHRAIAGNACATLDTIAYGKDDRLLINIPFHFTSAICHFLAVTLSGGALIGMEERLLPANLIQSATGLNANAFAGAPLQLRWIAEASRKHPLPIRWMMSSGDHLPVQVINQLRQSLPATQIYTVYGLTELGGRFCVLPHSQLDAFAGSVGKPIHGLTYSIRQSDIALEAPQGETGEIFVQGDYCFDGYCHNAEATAKTLTPYGVRTGDMGYVNAEGLLYIVGRNDDVFKVNGLKVSSIVIEQALMQTGFFDDVAVIPKDSPMFGIVPVACCVPKPGVTFSQPETLKQLSNHLPSNHMPASFILCESIPRTQSGKIMRRALIQQLETKS